jgi:hypothetical protein
MIEFELIKSLVSHVGKWLFEWLFDVEVELTRKRDAKRFLEKGRELLSKGCVHEANIQFSLAVRISPEIKASFTQSEQDHYRAQLVSSSCWDNPAIVLGERGAVVITSAEVLLVESVGAFYFGAGTPQVICRFEAVPPFRNLREQDRRISCLVWKGTRRKEDPGGVGAWHEFSPKLGLDGSQEFLDYLSTLTLPDASAFQGEFDTSATLQHVFLRVRRNAEIRSYDINMFSIGFTGDGAETIKALCRRLFALAGYADYNDTIYGTDKG